MGQSQINFVNRLQGNAAGLMQIAESFRKAVAVANARQYATVWTEADFSDVLIDGRPATKAEVVALVGVMTSFLDYLDNKPVATQDRATVFNKYRNDI